MQIDYQVQSQIELLGTLKRKFGAEFDRLPVNASSAGGDASSFHLANGMFGAVDAEILYSMIRLKQPKRIVEIGSGWTTRLMVQATAHNALDDAPCEIVSIDPSSRDNQYGKNALSIRKKLQDSPEPLDSLEPGDFLVVDSSHVFAKGGDIDVILQKLPKLEGVYVHFHDIFLPSGYPDKWSNRGYTEQFHLQDFLEDDSGYEVLLAANYLHVEQPALLAATFKSYDRNRPIGPGSFWIMKSQAVEKEFDATYGTDGPAKSVNADWALTEPGPDAPVVDIAKMDHEFLSDRGGRKCRVCGKTARAKAHS